VSLLKFSANCPRRCSLKACTLTVRHLEWVARDDAAAAEGLGLEALGAGLEGGERRRASLLVRDLLVGGKRHVEGHLRIHGWDITRSEQMDDELNSDDGEQIQIQTRIMCKTCRNSHFRESFLGRDGKLLKNCKPCREKQKTYRETYHRKHPHAAEENQARYNKTTKAKARTAKHRKTEKWAATRQRHRETELFQQTTDAYRNSDRRKEIRAAEYERIHSDPGLHLQHNIGCRISAMIRDSSVESRTALGAVGFGSRQELMDHFESMFEGWMNWSNHGVLSADPSSPRVWHVGHRIALNHFDPNNPGDVKRCWNPKNLFPQCARENIASQIKLPDEAILLRIRDCWPVAWGGVLPMGSIL